jgi:hypothetical protein
LFTRIAPNGQVAALWSALFCGFLADLCSVGLSSGGQRCADSASTFVCRGQCTQVHPLALSGVLRGFDGMSSKSTYQGLVAPGRVIVHNDYGWMLSPRCGRVRLWWFLSPAVRVAVTADEECHLRANVRKDLHILAGMMLMIFRPFVSLGLAASAK